MSDRNIHIIDADSSFGGAAGGTGLRVTGALAHPGPPLESPLFLCFTFCSTNENVFD